MRTLFFLFLFFPVLVFAQSIEVVTLKYRQAEDVIPLIQPMLSKGDAISGSGNQLFLRTRHMREIRKLIDRIDRMPRSLMISVYQGSSIEGVDDGDTYSTESGGTFRIRTEEGSPAYVKVGESIRDDAVFAGPYASGVVPQYREVTRGFYVLARMNGNGVTLDVSPMFDRPVAGGIDLARLSTKISGRVGEWIELGGAMQGRQSDAVRSGSDQRIWVRVDSP